MENLKKSQKICLGLLIAVALLAGCCLDSEGEAGWMALGVCLLSGVAAVMLMLRWDKKMEGENDGEND